MSTNKLKIINDPVHGFIKIPHEILFDVIEHRFFQRLRRISQTGLLSLVFPGATHTRFHHAIGAMHLMFTALETLKLKGIKISKEEEKSAMLAILLHDVGHGPFSHALESLLMEDWHHEKLSILLMNKINEEFDGELSMALEMFQGKYHRRFFNQLISSQLDVDRLDYLKRDSFFTGVSEGSVNTQRIISMMNVCDDELVIDEKGVYSIENFLTARMFMYWQVYYHKTSAAISSVGCGSAVVNSILKLGVPLTASNYIDIPVTATGIGTYTIDISNADNPGFSYTGSGTITTTGTSNIRVYGTGTPIKAGTLPFTVTINGVTCTMNIVIILPPKNVLVIGGAIPINTALNNSANFGINGKSKIDKVNTNVVGTYTATQLKNEINTKGTQVIVIGWSWNPDAASIAVLKEFIQKKKGFVFWSEAQDDQVFIKSLIDQTYGANVTMTDDEYFISTAKLDSVIPVDNPYINGVFGTIKDKYIRADDNASWTGITPETMPSALKPLITLPSNGGIGSGANTPRSTWVYGDGFLMCPDWGMLNYTGANYGNNAPISVGSGTFNGAQSWNGATVGAQNIQNTNVVNWVLFGNAMDYIFNYVQKNYDSSYKIP